MNGKDSITRRMALGAAAAALLAPAHSARAESPAEKGLAIAREAERRNKGWIDSTAKARMILRDRQGGASERLMETRSLESRDGADDGGKSLLIFRYPPDVNKTALLTHSHKTSDDDQWLFLPEIKRVKRITSGNKSGSFVGSEFTFEDMRDPQIEKYDFKWLKDEAFGGRECFVVQRTPKDPESGYSRLVGWIDKAEYRTHHVDFYDRKSFRLKTLAIADYRLYLGKYWRAHRLNMVNHQSGKSTELLWEDLRFRQNLREADFDRHAMVWLK